MPSATQAVVTKKNPFWLPKNRYYELKYFCLQFWDWQKRRAQLDGMATRENREPTEQEAIERAELSEKIQKVMTCCTLAAHQYDEILLTGVTKGLSYDAMSVKKVLPIARDAYYVIYRKFFWILDSSRK
ncbi:MAG: hypothetical protein J6U54_10045 [Clostridiales bacterium]|nr:hypothetical protein [Clostridiales bacterium]